MRDISIATLAFVMGCAVAPHYPAARSLVDLLGPVSGSERYLPLAPGHIVLVDVWSAECEDCDHALASDDAYQRSIGGTGFVLTVNVDADPRAADKCLERLGMRGDLVVLHDYAGRFKATRLPTEFVVDEHGIVRSVESGFSGAARARINETVVHLMREMLDKH